jgi:ribosomal protein L19E
MAYYQFEFLGQLSDIETITRGSGVRVRRHLEQKYGRGRWRKMKGKAMIRYPNDEIWIAEIHWYEAHGIGQRDHKAIKNLERVG